MLNLNFNPFPEIKTARLRLRKVTTGDAAEMFFLRSDPGVQRFVDRPRSLGFIQDAYFKENFTFNVGCLSPGFSQWL
jgi:hypothetical protein